MIFTPSTLQVSPRLKKSFKSSSIIALVSSSNIFTEKGNAYRFRRCHNAPLDKEKAKNPTKRKQTNKKKRNKNVMVNILYNKRKDIFILRCTFCSIIFFSYYEYYFNQHLRESDIFNDRYLLIQTQTRTHTLNISYLP